MKILFCVGPARLRGRFCSQPTREDAPATPSPAAPLTAPAGGDAEACERSACRAPCGTSNARGSGTTVLRLTHLVADNGLTGEEAGQPEHDGQVLIDNRFHLAAPARPGRARATGPQAEVASPARSVRSRPPPASLRWPGRLRSARKPRRPPTLALPARPEPVGTQQPGRIDEAGELAGSAAGRARGHPGPVDQPGMLAVTADRLRVGRRAARQPVDPVAARGGQPEPRDAGRWNLPRLRWRPRPRPGPRMPSRAAGSERRASARRPGWPGGRRVHS